VTAMLPIVAFCDPEDRLVSPFQIAPFFEEPNHVFYML
jgi:hypothetical protein